MMRHRRCLSGLAPRTLAVIVLLVGLTVATLTLWNIHRTRGLLDEALLLRGEVLAQGTAAGLGRPLRIAALLGEPTPQDRQDMDAVLASVMDHPEVLYVRVEGPDGAILATHTCGPSCESEISAARIETGATKEKIGHVPNFPRWVRRKCPDGTRCFHTALPVDGPQGQRLGLVRLGLSADAIDRQAARLHAESTMLGVSMLLLSAGALFVFLRHLVLNPVSRIHRVVSLAGEGTFDQRVGIHRSDEVGGLAKAVDRSVASLRDLVERLTRSETYVRDILGSMNDVLLVVSPEGKVLEANPAAEAVLGRSEQDLAGMPAADLFQGDASFGPDDTPASDTGTNGRRASEWVLKAKDGRTIPVLATCSPLRDSRGRRAGTVIVAHDLTEQKASERERAEIEDRLHRSQRLESLGRLAGGVAHDFNNLLGAILGHVGFLAPGMPENSQARADLEEIRRAARRGADLTRQLLAFGSGQNGEATVVDLDRLVGQVQGLFRRVVPENVELEIPRTSGLWSVYLDPGQVERVLANLVSNACDAMPKGGRLSIRTRNVAEREAPEPGLAGVPRGDLVLLEVSDSGHGMSPDVAGRVFEPFFTTKPRGKGTGLGLATAYGIVRQAGGDIRMESVPGRGTTVCMVFPAVREVPRPIQEQPAETAAPAPEPALAPRTLLVVEDETALRTVAVRTLERRGYRVLQAPHGEEALRLAEDPGQTIDVLVTDVIMPGISGKELATRMVRLRPDIEVVFMSGYSDEHLGEPWLGGRLAPLVHKPFSAEQLVAAVRQVLLDKATVEEMKK